MSICRWCLSREGAINGYSIEEGSSKENITLMFSFSANRKICCATGNIVQSNVTQGRAVMSFKFSVCD